MTRINSDISVKDLSNKHLFSEYREMSRIPNIILKKLDKNINREFPTKLKLGNGHVLYFYNKIKYLHNRFLSIKNELKFRNYSNLSIDDKSFIELKYKANKLYNDISKDELKYNSSVLVKRILERSKNKIIKIGQKEISFDEYKNKLKKYENIR